MVYGTFYISGICNDIYGMNEVDNSKSVLEKMCDERDMTFFDYSQKMYDYFAESMGKKGFYAEQAWTISKDNVPCEVTYENDRNDIKLMVIAKNNDDDERIEVRGVLYKDYRRNFVTDDVSKGSHLRIDYRLSEENAKEFAKAVSSKEFSKKLGIVFHNDAEVKKKLDKFLHPVKIVDLSTGSKPDKSKGLSM